MLLAFFSLSLLSCSLLLALTMQTPQAALFFTADGAQTLLKVAIHACNDAHKPPTHVRNAVV